MTPINFDRETDRLSIGRWPDRERPLLTFQQDDATIILAEFVNDAAAQFFVDCLRDPGITLVDDDLGGEAPEATHG